MSDAECPTCGSPNRARRWLVYDDTGAAAVDGWDVSWDEADFCEDPWHDTVSEEQT